MAALATSRKRGRCQPQVIVGAEVEFALAVDDDPRIHGGFDGADGVEETRRFQPVQFLVDPCDAVVCHGLLTLLVLACPGQDQKTGKVKYARHALPHVHLPVYKTNQIVSIRGLVG